MHQGWVFFLCGAAFFAGLVDAVAGGGGLISLPALLAAGVPPHLALGTNKVQSFAGTAFSVIRYQREGYLHKPIAVPAACAALVGSFLGARLAMAVPGRYLEHLVPWILVGVGVFTFARPGFGEVDRSAGQKQGSVLTAGLIGLFLGCYDGFFGPGTGSFLIFFFVILFGFGFVRASANAKPVNLASNIAALAAFAAAGEVMWRTAWPMALANIAGNWLGAGLAVKRGARVIKPLFGLVLAGLLVKLLFFSS